MSEDTPKVDLNIVQVVASALAAVSSAVLLSTVGVAGTIIGAAAGSVIATVGSSIYSYSLRVSRERVAAAAQVAATVRARRGHDGGTTQRLPAQDSTDPAETDQDRTDQGHTNADEPGAHGENGSGPGWRDSLGHLPWKRIAALTGAVFLAAMVVIVGFELVAGRPVSEYTGGTSKSDTSRTTIPGLGSRKASKDTDDTPKRSPSPSATGSATPSESASPSSTASPTPSPTATPTGTGTPTAAPTDPTASATTGTTPTPAPTAGATPAQ